mgnify:CR=1 FL=1
MNKKKRYHHIQVLKWVVISVFMLLYGCGKAYFPIELNVSSRTDRVKNQQDVNINLVAMTENEIKIANMTPYIRKVVEAGDLNRPAKFLKLDSFLNEQVPQDQEPGPYRLGFGDILMFSEFLEPIGGMPKFVSRKLVVSDQGAFSIGGLGQIAVAGLSQTELEDKIYSIALEQLSVSIINILSV